MITVLVEAWENSAWKTITGYYGGSFNQMPNAPSRLEITFPNKDGKNFDTLHINQFIRLNLGIDGLQIYPRFYGFVANRAVTEAPGQSNISFECFDLLHQAARELCKYTELGENVDGMDVGSAIRYILATLWENQLPPQPLSDADVDGINGTDYLRIITSSDKFYSATYSTKLSLIQSLNELAVIDNYPEAPLPYILYQDGEGRFHHRPVEDLVTGTPRMTLSYAGNLNRYTQKTRTSKLITHGTVTGQKDPNDSTGAVFEGSFIDASWVQMEGEWRQKFSKAWAASVDDCRDYAMRKVALYRELYEPIEIETRRGYFLIVGDLVMVVNPATGKSETMRIMELTVKFQPTDFSVMVTCGAMNYLPTDYI